jgi:hypothetical protein
MGAAWTPGRRNLEGLVFSRGLVRSEWEKGRGAISLTISTNFTPAAGGLSVTYVAAACDNRVYQTEHLKVTSLASGSHRRDPLWQSISGVSRIPP